LPDECLLVWWEMSYNDAVETSSLEYWKIRYEADIIDFKTNLRNKRIDLILD
jgi:hypothetical protein